MDARQQYDQAELIDARLRSVVAQLPHRVRSQYSGRLAKLTADGWRLVEVAAVMPQPFTLEGMANIMAEPIGDLFQTLREVLAAGVLVSNAEALTFRHDLVRRAVYQQLPEPIRMTLLRRLEESEAGRPESESSGGARADDLSRRPYIDAVGGLNPQTKASGQVGGEDRIGWMRAGDLTAARAEAESVLGGTEDLTSDGSLAWAISTLGYIAWNEGRIADSIGLQRASVHRADRSQSRRTSPIPHFGLAVMLTATGDFPQACDCILAVEAAVGESGVPSWAPAPLVLRARLFLAEGRLAAAKTEAESALSRAEPLGLSRFTAAASVALATVAFRESRLDEAVDQLERVANEPVEDRNLFDPSWGLWVEAQVAEVRQGAGAGFAALGPVYADPARHTRLLLEQADSAAWMVRTALAVGEIRAAERLTQFTQTLAADNPEWAFVVALCSHARALLERDSDVLEQLGAQYRHPAARAAACEDAGDLLARRGHRCSARAQLERALAGFERMGRERDRTRVQSRLAELGSGLRRIRRSDGPVSGWGSLTDAERRVADQVAQGLTNHQAADRLSLSRHTVDFHLRQVFRKLDIGSRVELARLALDRDLKAASADRQNHALA